LALSGNPGQNPANCLSFTVAVVISWRRFTVNNDYPLMVVGSIFPCYPDVCSCRILSPFALNEDEFQKECQKNIERDYKDDSSSAVAGAIVLGVTVSLSFIGLCFWCSKKNQSFKRRTWNRDGGDDQVELKEDFSD
jgi:hypothetical protein